MSFFFMCSLCLGNVKAQELQVCTLAGFFSGTPIDSTGSAARFWNAQSIVMDTLGNFYVGEDYRIRKVTPQGTVTSIAGGNAVGYADGTGSAALFNGVVGLAIDNREGCLYVADFNNNSIRKVVIATGVVTTLAGGTQGFADGVGTAAKFFSIGGVAFDPTTRMLYISDYRNYRIRKLDVATNAVTTVVGNGAGATLDGVGTNARVNGPWGMAVKGNTLYFTEFIGCTVRKMNLTTNTVTTIAGSGTGGFADSTGLLAQFKYPRGIALDALDNIYVADDNNNRIRKITSQGVVTTLAGNGVAATIDGSALSAQFRSPSGVAINAAGEIFVAEYLGARVRKIARAASATDNMTWTGLANNLWSTPCNWTPYGVPTITNAVTIPNRLVKPTINSTASAKKITIQAGSTLTITSTTLNLANTGDNVLELGAGANLINNGNINVSSGLGIVNNGTITNNTCSTIRIATGMYNNSGGTTNNAGLVQVSDTLYNQNGTFNNTGIVQANSLSGPITNSGNTSVVVNSSIPIFTYGGTFSGTINGIYTNAPGTTSAGTFTAPNEFRPLQTLPVGTQTLYTRIVIGSCSYTVPFRYTYTQRVATQDIDNSTVLYQNRPNPFHKETIIAFALPQTTKATVSVFDITGKQIFVSDKTYNAGYNEIVLDQSVFQHTGTYFCRLTTDKQTIVRKMQFIAE